MGNVDGCGYDGQQKYTLIFVMLVGQAEQIEVHLSQFFADFSIMIALIAH